MTRDEFREKINVLYKKAEMDSYLDWPFVYDCDESGKILVDEIGDIWFSDKNMNWIKTSYNLENIDNMRYSVAYEEPGVEHDNEEPCESYIIINFKNGDRIEFLNRKESYGVEVDLRVKRDREIDDVEREILSSMKDNVNDNITVQINISE